MGVERVVVIGAGIGGLTSAIELARAGMAVTVVERAGRPGGKMRETMAGGAAIDSGPTVLTMRWVFDEIFQAAGSALDDHVRLRPAEVLARHAWGPDRLDLFSDTALTADAIGDLAGAREAAGYLAFCAEAKRIYDTLRQPFLDAQQTNAVGLASRIGPAHVGDLFAIRPFETLWKALGDHFRDPRLRQLFGRYATYCGSSPFAAPATLMLIAHVEQAGVWLVDGGMQRMAEALEALAVQLGVTFRYRAHAEQILVEGGRASAVRLADGDELAAGHVVVNADPAAIASGAFGVEVARAVSARSPSVRSLSAVTWAFTAQTVGFDLARHTVFFSDDYKAEFDDIFAGGRLPSRPTVYVCAQDRDDRGAGADGPERLLVLVNAPANGDQRVFSQEELSACERQVLDQFRRCGLQVDWPPPPSSRTTPDLFETMFPATGGALYGPASHGWMSAFQRPGARTRLPGLYLAGGGAHPGAGAPMAALSGRLAARRLLKDRASTRPFRRAAMPGGMSTP